MRLTSPLFSNSEGNKIHLSHEELISQSLLYILEDAYDELEKTEKDAVMMLLIQNITDMS